MVITLAPEGIIIFKVVIIMSPFNQVTTCKQIYLNEFIAQFLSCCENEDFEQKRLAARGQIFSWETTSLASSKLVMSLLSDFD
jgi:hypothetical protein